MKAKDLMMTTLLLVQEEEVVHFHRLERRTNPKYRENPRKVATNQMEGVLAAGAPPAEGLQLHLTQRRQ